MRDGGTGAVEAARLSFILGMKMPGKPPPTPTRDALPPGTQPRPARDLQRSHLPVSPGQRGGSQRAARPPSSARLPASSGLTQTDYRMWPPAVIANRRSGRQSRITYEVGVRAVLAVMALRRSGGGQLLTWARSGWRLPRKGCGSGRRPGRGRRSGSRRCDCSAVRGSTPRRSSRSLRRRRSRRVRFSGITRLRKTS